ncbi:MAG TPA: exodeoxyribonuclease VII small subunit [Pseudomonadales bacterium]
MAKSKTASFEQSLQTLEQLVRQMDSGELSLEQSLGVFEQGIGLIRQCQQQLQQAEQKVQLLVDNNGELQTRPFDADTP